jgi:hypothetical protein
MTERKNDLNEKLEKLKTYIRERKRYQTGVDVWNTL